MYKHNIFIHQLLLQKYFHLFQKLSLTTSPLFTVSSIKCNTTNTHCLLFGSNGLAVVELPRRWGDDNLFEGGKKNIQCK